MFVRKKPNKSGVVSIQIIDKSSGKYKVYKTIGSSKDPQQILALLEEAHQELVLLNGQQSINFDQAKEQQVLDLFFEGIQSIRLVGPELLLGKLFDEIGFNLIPDELFRALVITRLSYPVSKLKTTDYIFKHKGEHIDVDKVYRYLDKFHSEQMQTVQQISYQHTLKVLDGHINIVFYDVTTLYFETDEQDDLRKTGFSKEGKHQHPQILLGLLASIDGYPLAYELFEGNKYEGHTLLPVLTKFRAKYQLGRLVVVADAGMLSNENIRQLEDGDYEYILGARIKAEPTEVQQQILSLSLSNGQCAQIQKSTKTKLVISYSESRAKKDKANRERGLQKLEKNLGKGKLSKRNINNRGYNKYLKLDGDVKVSIDYEKWDKDSKWDGLKGYMTNAELSKEEVIEQYGNLWSIERAFRISKTDLRIRPIYHRLIHRIEAHICIAFCAYKIYKELERQLREKNAGLSPEKAIDIAKTIFKVTIMTPYSKMRHERLHIPNEEQKILMNLFDL